MQPSCLQLHQADITSFVIQICVQRNKFAINYLTFMKRILYSLLFGLVAFSCTKSKTEFPPEEYYIRAKFDGQLKEFKELMSAQRGIDNGRIVHLVCGASQNKTSSYPSLDFEIWDLSGNISVGTYSELNKDIISRYATDGFKRHNSISNAAEDFQVVITEMTGEIVKGRFNGTITNDAGQDILITDGEFYFRFDY